MVGHPKLIHLAVLSPLRTGGRSALSPSCRETWVSGNLLLPNPPAGDHTEKPTFPAPRLHSGGAWKGRESRRNRQNNHHDIGLTDRLQRTVERAHPGANATKDW